MLRGIADALEKAPRTTTADSMVQLVPILLELEKRAAKLIGTRAETRSDTPEPAQLRRPHFRLSSTQLPRPGSDVGPCLEKCEHIDCARIRRDATTECSVCGHPIGYEIPYVADAICGIAHYGCVPT